jgi:hypothetical protein
LQQAAGLVHLDFLRALDFKLLLLREYPSQQRRWARGQHQHLGRLWRKPPQNKQPKLAYPKS